ncbi:hypothetical protein Z517_01068 [Fonsecaea pedrosoi CBS 271.37]|uniref:Beta-lactamase-related domain-containing protein n=1 Tax=Fonsecaea pedrosoi CBS 271.37 TaxID=1442368 RepID=A0A0D2E6F7_9EURO|nr:uncharacterized protein Z517_01068 [Fonsecaea pedrosoi CBS 271.37]KIW85676.1 hypothetical protein Z517_01068 [Fonsecaea pedrosoi CBS 271.37]
MAPRSRTAILLTTFSFISLIGAACFSQTPVFPPPTYSSPQPELLEAFQHIEASLSSLFATSPDLNTSSYSIEVTSPHSTLWSTFHTAADKDPERPGAEHVDGRSSYRIASITKVFTVLGILQQHAAGNLSLDDAVDKYIPALKHQSGGTIPWEDITLRSLASQFSGIPRDWAQSDLIKALPDPTVLGLPPLPPSAPEWSRLPKCDEYNEYKPCTPADLLDYMSDKPPVFAPNQKSTYSNIAFELLGLVLANVTGTSYEEYIESAILRPLEMTATSFRKPPDSVAILPKGNAWYWDVDEGVQNPTGGLYCPSSDMSVFLRHVLKEYGNVADAKVNWLVPVSFAPGLKSFYGMPWEILRPDHVIPGSPARTVSFFTKGGGLPGYRTLIVLVPEYELGITIFTGGDESFLDQVVELVTVPLIRAADRLARRQARHRYTGTFTAAGPENAINSSLRLSYSDAHGLEITQWVSNGTDVLAILPAQFRIPDKYDIRLQVIPTSLYRDQAAKKGELWRIAFTLGRSGHSPTSSSSSSSSNTNVWEDFCTSDVDTHMYAGKPLNEIVFWRRDAVDGVEGEQQQQQQQQQEEDDDGGWTRYDVVELTAFRINLTRLHGDGQQSDGRDDSGSDGRGGCGGGEKNMSHHTHNHDHDQDHDDQDQVHKLVLQDAWT